jgi:hypothetical protein
MGDILDNAKDKMQDMKNKGYETKGRVKEKIDQQKDKNTTK